MPCLHLDGVPEDLHDALQQMARRQHESVSQIAVAILRRALLNPKTRQGVLFPLSSMTPRSQRLRDGLKADADEAAPAPLTLAAEPARPEPAMADADEPAGSGGLSGGGDGGAARVAASRSEG